jgi:hypothetical protein
LLPNAAVRELDADENMTDTMSFCAMTHARCWPERSAAALLSADAYKLNDDEHSVGGPTAERIGHGRKRILL